MIVAGRPDLEADHKTAALLAVLRDETSPLVRWACLWALGRCGTEAAEAVEAVGEMSEDPFIRSRAFSSARAIRERDAKRG